MTQIIDNDGVHHYLLDIKEQDFDDLRELTKKVKISPHATITDWAINLRAFQYNKYCNLERSHGNEPLEYEQWFALKNAKTEAHVETLLLFFHLNCHIDNLQLKSPKITIEHNNIELNDIKIRKTI